MIIGRSEYYFMLYVIFIQFYAMIRSNDHKRFDSNPNHHPSTSDTTISMITKIAASTTASISTSSMTKSNSQESVPSVAICACMKDEYRDVVEWVEYHISMGINKFYLADNNSTSPQAYIELFPFIQKGIVEYYYLTNPKEPNAQVYAYLHCIKSYAQNHFFLAFIDVDEFIVVNGTRSIPQVLSNYTQYGGLTLNWYYFSSSGHIARPKGGVLKNYWKCIESFYVKTIVNTKYVRRFQYISVHNFNYTRGRVAVDTNGNRVHGSFNPYQGGIPDPSLYHIMYINHYVTKSLEDFKRKHQRGNVDGALRDLHYFHKINKIAVKNCPILQKRNNSDETTSHLINRYLDLTE